MHASVSSYARTFLHQQEGTSQSMYLDGLGTVRVGSGLQIDPLSMALRLPFVHRSGGNTATPSEIEEAWQRVKDQGRRRERHFVRHRGPAALSPADLMLPLDLLQALSARRLERMTAAMAQMTPEFRRFEEWPADAQLALIGMGWALGPGFARHGGWPGLRAACAAQDFKLAAAQCGISQSSVRRNQAHRHLFANAGNVLLGQERVERLFYPTILLPPIGLKNSAPALPPDAA